MKQAVIVVDLGFGDSGKGTMTEFFVKERSASLVVRWSGGPQCAHNVVLENGTHHTFSMFGAGTFEGAATHLTKHVLVEPMAIHNEYLTLRHKGCDPVLTMDPGCLIITPWHRMANRIREIARGKNRHGSVGLGIGETRMDQLSNNLYVRVGEVIGSSFYQMIDAISKKKLADMKPYSHTNVDAAAAYEEMKTIDVSTFVYNCEKVFTRDRIGFSEEIVRKHKSIVFEGSQGILLDEKYGFYPHNTWTDVTPKNARELATKAGHEIECVGVLRTYFTRHGAGPFPTEDNTLGVTEPHNDIHPYMGKFRVGAFDCELARYAISHCGGLDGIALTHMDRIPTYRVADEYGTVINSTEWLSSASPKYFRADPFIQTVEERLGQTVSYTSHGPTAAHKLACRAAVRV